MDKKGVKFKANQSLHTIMKLYFFAEDAVNKILLQRSVMIHLFYDSCVYCASLLSWNSQGEEADKEGKKDKVCGSTWRVGGSK
jgi:hypothetical protein